MTALDWDQLLRRVCHIRTAGDGVSVQYVLYTCSFSLASQGWRLITVCVYIYMYIQLITCMCRYNVYYIIIYIYGIPLERTHVSSIPFAFESCCFVEGELRDNVHGYQSMSRMYGTHPV